MGTTEIHHTKPLAWHCPSSVWEAVKGKTKTAAEDLRRTAGLMPGQRKIKMCERIKIKKFNKMNKRIKLATAVVALLMVAAIVVTFEACKKEEQPYSCNKSINDWVKDNKGDFADITREQIGILPLSLQKAVYRSLTPQHQYDLWMEKLAWVKNEYGKAIYKPVNQLMNKVTVNWYDDSAQETDYEFLNKWESDMLNNVFDSVTYYVCFCTLSTTDELEMLQHPDDIDYSWITFPEGILISDFSKEAPGGGSHSVVDCMCLWHISCAVHGGGLCKKDVKCNPRRSCGLLGTETCTGLCEELLTDHTDVNYK